MTQVKQHSFFKDINWDTLARQKVQFVLFICFIFFKDISFAEADPHGRYKA